MIGSIRERARVDLLSFGDGLIAMIHEPESLEAMAAATLLAETLNLHHTWLKGQLGK